MEGSVYGVWLQQALGEGSRKVPALLEYFGSCRAVYESDDVERRLCGLLLPVEMDKMANTPLDTAEEIMEACQRLGYSVLTPDNPDFPERLLNLPDYPAALYISGELPVIDKEVCIGMVGTRRASRYGYTVANELAKDLAACGAVIVSGCARGIDTASHQGAILGGGKTIAVLGCGINTHYNMENEGLRKVISTSGALISEYPPGSPALSFHFPIRNRIISALSLGVIVVEAGAQSGSLITANLALEQGKDVFSVPGEINSYQAKGTNRLIFDGATPIESAADVLENYIGKYPHRLTSINLQNPNSRVYEKHVRPKWDREAIAEEYGITPEAFPQKPDRKDRSDKKSSSENERRRNDDGKKQQDTDASILPIGISKSAQRVWNVLDTTPKHFHELMSELAMDSSELSRCITELELYAAVRALPGNKYTKG